MTELLDADERLSGRAGSIFDRLRGWLHKLNSGRYEQHVPQEVREFAECEHVPIPERFIPSIEGRRVTIPTTGTARPTQITRKSQRQVRGDPVDGY